MSKSTEQKLADIHAKAVKTFDGIQSAVRDERLQCLQDRRFYSIAGAQWEGALGDQFENKPKFEVNKIHLAVIRIINEYRNNRISALFVPKDGSNNDKLSEACAGLYRADEQDSGAEEAYDNAFEEAVGGGFGAWRLRAEYEDDEDEDDEKQRIRMEPIFDADSSVFFDLNAKRQDKADAKECFVLTGMTLDAYEAEHNDSPASWPKDIQQTEFDWFSPDVVYIAEYYVIEKTKQTVYFYKGIDGEELKVTDEELEEEGKLKFLTATGFKLARQKKLNRNKCRKYLMNGARILEDCGYIAGRFIPIVPTYGKRWFIDSVERCMGHVRLSKDAQRLKNMQLSKLGEISALTGVEKPIFTPEQMLGHALMWAEDNIRNYPYLLLNSVFDQNGQPVQNGPIGYTKAPSIPPAMAALMQITEQDMQDLLGNQQAGEELPGNTSGIAVELIQNKLDMQTFIYISNFAKAVKRSAEIWLSMAKDILVEDKRKMKTVEASGETATLEIRKPVLNENGETVYENDLADAKFDVAVEVGPTSASKRSATVRGLTGMMQITQDPETLQVLGAMSMMNMEGEGIGEVRDYYRKKLIRMGVVKPNEEEKKELEAEQANQQPDPNAKFLEASAKEAEAKAIKTMAETELVGAKIEETRANAASIVAGMDTEQRRQIMELLDALKAESDSQQMPVQQPLQPAEIPQI